MDTQPEGLPAERQPDDPLSRDLAMTAPMIAKSAELYAWFTALVDAGFGELQAYGLLPPLLMTGFIRREQA
jgi:hypothetical protein